MDDQEMVDLRAVDWSSVEWTADCWVLEQELPVTLSAASDGWIEHATGAPGEVNSWTYEMKVDDVVYADVTGDGADNAVFFGYCGQGNLADSRVVVWGHDDDGEAVQLPTVVTLRDAGASDLDGVTEADGKVRVTLVEHDDDGEWSTVTDWLFDGESWFGAEVSRERQQEASPPAASTGSASGFSSPSGNIQCQAHLDDPGEEFLRCVVLSGLDPQPEELSPCDDWGLEQDSIDLSADGQASTTCDEWVERDQPALDYGQRWESGPFACTSEETGIECSGPGGSGFMVSRAMWTTW